MAVFPPPPLTEDRCPLSIRTSNSWYTAYTERWIWKPTFQLKPFLDLGFERTVRELSVIDLQFGSRNVSLVELQRPDKRCLEKDRDGHSFEHTRCEGPIVYRGHLHPGPLHGTGSSWGTTSVAVRFEMKQVGTQFPFDCLIAS